MPDLGQYAVEVSLAYAVSLTLLFIIVGLTVRRSRRVTAQLAQGENNGSSPIFDDLATGDRCGLRGFGCLWHDARQSR